MLSGLWRHSRSSGGNSSLTVSVVAPPPQLLLVDIGRHHVFAHRLRFSFLLPAIRSSRTPLYFGCRSRPPGVALGKSISTRICGLTHHVFSLRDKAIGAFVCTSNAINMR
jgi:hypothetical protein